MNLDILNFLRKKHLFLFFFILVFSIFLRLYKLQELPSPIHPDESFMGQSAIAILEGSKNFLDTYHSSTVIANIIIAIFIKFFGVTVITLRIQAVLFGVATNIFLYLIAKDLFNRRIALISFFIASFSHVAIAYSRLNVPCIQAPFFFVLTSYILNLGIKRKHTLFFALGGVSSGLSLYTYTGAKIIFVLGIAFLLMQYRKLKWEYWISYIGIFLLISLPLVIYALGSNNYLQRESQVTILSKPDYFYSRWETTNIVTILYQQFKTNFLGFITLEDNSNQYGNGILLDKISSIFFILSFIFIFIHCYISKKKRVINIHTLRIAFFTLWLLFIIFLISLSESPPLSTRLLILYPTISLFISYALDTIYRRLINLKRDFGKFFIYTSLLIILVLNLKIYFYDYVKKSNAYYQWIEPNSSIAFYAKSHQNLNIFILPNPHTYANQSIIQVINYPNKYTKDLNNYLQADFLLESISPFSIIIPLTPKDAADSSLELKNYLLQKISGRNDIQAKYYYGIPCRNCLQEPIFLLIYKNT